MACGNNLVSAASIQSDPVNLGHATGPSFSAPLPSAKEVDKARLAIAGATANAANNARSASTIVAAEQAVRAAQDALRSAQRARGLDRATRKELIRTAEDAVRESTERKNTMLEDDERRSEDERRANWEGESRSRLALSKLGVVRDIYGGQSSNPSPPANPDPGHLGSRAPASLPFGSLEDSGLVIERSETITVDTRMSYDQLTPSTEYKLNGQTYVTDATGLPAYAAAELRLERAPRHREGTKIGHLGEAADVGGHLIAARFGGVGSGPNLVPQNVKLNGNSQLQYGQMESTWADLLGCGARVFVDIRLQESGEIPTRPKGIWVRFTVDPAGADLGANQLGEFADGGVFENFFPNSAP